MARKINVKLILRLRDAGMSRSSIASTRKMSRNSVSDVFRIADERHITYANVQDIVDWDDERIRNWAKSIGKSTGAVIDRIFSCVDIKEQGYNPSLAVLRLSRTYSDARLETACELALSRGIRSPRYRHLKAILSANQDIIYKEQQEALAEPEDTSMGYLRGSDYYKKGDKR